MISLCFFKKKSEEEKKWKEKFRLLYLYIWTVAYCFRKQSVFTYHISWVKHHSVPLSNWACINYSKDFLKKKNVCIIWEENNSPYNMTCNTKTTCVRLSNFCIKIVLYCFKIFPWKCEKNWWTIFVITTL